MNPPCHRDGSSAGAMERFDMTHPASRLEGVKKGVWRGLRGARSHRLSAVQPREDPRFRDSDAGQGADPASVAALDPARLRL